MKRNVDTKKLNEVIDLSSKILKIFYFVVIIVGIYAITLIFKEWGVFAWVLGFFKIISPFFIGLIIAWLFNPFVTWLQRKKINRVLGTVITFVLILLGIWLLFNSIIPLLSEQINDFVGALPSMLMEIGNWIENVLDKISSSGVDVTAIRTEIFGAIEKLGMQLTTNLPMMTFDFIKNFAGFLGVFIMGLMIGFYLLFDFDKASETLLGFIPKKYRAEIKNLLYDIDAVLKSFVHGTLFVCFFIFLASSIGLWLAGVNAPIVFGLFCGITNVIPYAGPYIGAIPAIIMGFSMSPTTGLLSIIVLAIVQFLEGNFLQPIIMGKTMKLHPVIIILSLLIFGSIFGVWGMILATPIVAALKVIGNFIIEKVQLYQKEKI